MKTIYIITEVGTGIIINIAYNTRLEAQERVEEMESMDEFTSFEILELQIKN